MIYVGVDPSLTSTAVTIITPEKIHYFNYTTTTKASKWRKAVEHFVKFVDVFYTDDNDYSTQEIFKLKEYGFTTQKIANDIKEICQNKDVVIGIESYSQQSAFGPLQDLITFGTLLREALYQIVTKNIKIIAPKSLKSGACRLSYETDKKGVCRNPNGLAGGSFVKHNMLESLMDSGLESELITYLKENRVFILPLKSIPKPFDDLVDSELIARVLITQQTVL